MQEKCILRRNHKRRAFLAVKEVCFMLNEEILLRLAGADALQQGRILFNRMLVREAKKGKEESAYIVSDEGKLLNVRVSASSARCECGKPFCAHCVAAALLSVESGAMTEMDRIRREQAIPALFDAVAQMLPESGNIRMLPVLFLSREGLRIGLKIGEERLYVVRHIPHFLQCREKGEALPLGKGFEYRPEWMHFDEKQTRLIDILAEVCEQAAGKSLSGTDARVLLLSQRSGKRVLDALMHTPFMLHIGSEQYAVSRIEEKLVPLNFHVSGNPQRLQIVAEMPEVFHFLTKDARFVFSNGEVIAVPREQQQLLCTLQRFSCGSEASFSFNQQDTARVMRELMPFLLRSGTVSIDPALESRFLHLEPKTKIYLDKSHSDVTAQVSFCYGPYEIDPFVPETAETDALLLRDAVKEKQVLDTLAHFGFRVRRGQVYLTGSEQIFDFVTTGAAQLTQMAEVFFSKDFRRMTPKKPLLHGSVKVKGNRLVLEMMDGDTPIEELLPLMEALRKKRRYFRFKEGTFLDLSDADAWQPLAEIVSEATRDSDTQDMQNYWASCLGALIREHNLDVSLDDQARKTAALSYKAPPCPIDCLRPYQLRGYEWLHSLHALGMGGILADDMGLGKTVQMLATLLSCVETEEEKLPSLIVAPTSLTYKWLNECARFAPKLKVLLLSGSQAARAEQIETLRGKKAPDLVITSYPLIRRDIGLMKDILFRFAVLDEAQQIKNVQSVGAHAVKQLTAKTRIALTGTPMENHAGELWSIFDFVLPGYLPKYTDFLRRYSDGDHADDLRRRIRPFLMRRVKADVLQDLPEKMETVLMAQMSLEQQRVYQAALLQKRERVYDILQNRGITRGRAEVLSAITELRQICCHPVLCLPDYQGMSGKMELLMDVLPAALQSGKRALIFSQFTSMLRLIEKRLNAENIPTLYLDGETPPQERVKLTQAFNEGKCDVFLISLKAGGTGLNLTGADLVIHYDPWWNPTTEEQATSRAHRIGQTRKVEVIRLVMHHSIEEQVLSMSDRKRRLFDKLITPGEEMPTRLSDKDILSLFDGD